MGFDNECIINIQSLKGEYFCPVCRLLVYPNEALQSQCSHLYCKPCLTYIVRTTQACPYDGYLVTEADSKPLLESNKALADTIGKIPVNCLFHRSGCTWKGNLADCKSHCSGCPFGDSSVMCNRCGIQIVHREVEDHAQKCPGVQSQTPQPDNGQVTSGTTSNAPSNQNQTVASATTPASQAQVASVTSASVQKSAQQVNPATQPQTAQVAVPSAEQWYQQQQQFQQYYQQYPVYDPNQQQQQHYQQYYPYQQQAAQQFQQPAQVYSSKVPGQQAPPSHTPQQPQQHSHAPPTAQLQSHTPQATPNIQQQIQPPGQPQTLPNQVAYTVPQSQPQAYSQVQPYVHPQTVPQQSMQMPLYQQTHPQMQQPPPPPHHQMQNQPYSQPQAQHYTHSQTHPPAQTQTHPHPNSHNMSLPPQHPAQPVNLAGPPQAQNAPTHAVTGYQSYQQAQALPLQQTQAGAPHSLHMNGSNQQPLNHSQFQGQYSQQSAQVRPSHIPAMMPNQQATMVPPQAQNTGFSVAQVPVYPQSRHPGYPVQHHSGMQPVQHASSQPQGFTGHSPYVQQHPVMQAPVQALAPGQVYQQNSTHAPPIQPNARPVMSHGGGQQPYSQPSGPTNAAHLLPTQISTNQASVNQSYSSVPVHGQELLKPSVAGMPGAQNMEKGKQEQNNVETSGNTARVGTSELSSTEILEQKPLVGSDGKPHAFENGTLQKGNLMTREGTVDNAEMPSATDSADVGNQDGKENEQRSDKGFNTSALPPVSSVPAAKQIPGSHSIRSSDLGRNQPQFLGQPPGQLRPQVQAKMHPSHSIYLNNSPGALYGSSTVAPYGSGSGSLGLPQGHINRGKFPVRPPFVSPPPGTQGGITGGARPDFHEGNLHKHHLSNSMEGPGGFSDGRHSELHPHGSMEQRPFGQTQSLHRLHDERMNFLPEEQLKPFPSGHNFGSMDFEGDLQKIPRPSHLEGGPHPRFPPAGPHDQGPQMFGDRFKPAGFRDVRPGFHDFPRPGPGFDHHGSPNRDFRTNESHSYPSEKSFRESRFPGLSGHLQSDAPINMHGSDHRITGPRKHSRHGDAMGQDMLPIHSRRVDFGPHNVHSREATGRGAFQGHLEMGEPPFPGSYLPPRPFGERFGMEMPGYPHRSESGFRGRFARDDGFYRGEMEPFDNPRKRKHASVMCRICNVDCETVEGLDLHSQTREHQKEAMDMVISIKQQHSRKQRVSNHRSMHEEGRENRTTSFEGQGKKH